MLTDRIAIPTLARPSHVSARGGMRGLKDDLGVARAQRKLEHPKGAFPWTRVSSPKLLVDGPEFYPDVFEALDNAKHSINIIEYGFVDNKELKPFLPTEKAEEMVHLGQMLKKRLIDAISRGVEVRLMVDRYGSDVDGQSAQMYRELEAAGVKVVVQDTMQPFNAGAVVQKGGKLRKMLGNPRRGINREVGHADHRKIFLIDGTKAYTGGMGFEDHFWNRMHDNMVRLGGPIVAQVQSMFLEDFAAKGGQVPEPGTPEYDKFFPPLPKGDIKAQLLMTSPTPGEHYRAIEKAYLAEINASSKSIEIVNPYFYSGRVQRALARAARRGVDVKVIVPKYSENGLGETVQKGLYEHLQKAGVKIYEWPTLLHAKNATFDGKRSIIGSANLDAESLWLNHDVVIRFASPEVTRMLKKQFFDPSYEKCGQPIPMIKPSMKERASFLYTRWARLFI